MMKPTPMRLLFCWAGTNRFPDHARPAHRAFGERLAPFNVHAPGRHHQELQPESAGALVRHYRDSVDGIAFMALEHFAVREAVNTASGVPTVTLISDIPNARRAAYLGLDNCSADAPWLSIVRFIGRRAGEGDDRRQFSYRA